MTFEEKATELSVGEIAAAISNEAVRLMSEYTGRGPTKARTTITEHWVFITLEDLLTKGEQRLVGGGFTESVLTVRHEYQLLMRDELQTAVERLTGRPIQAFLSANNLDPDVAVEALMFAP